MQILGRPIAIAGLMALLTAAGCATMTGRHRADSDSEATKGIVATQRTALVHYAPSFGAPVVLTVPADTRLDWLENQERNGFYRVGGPKGSIGWIRQADLKILQRTVITGVVAQAACANTLDQCSLRGCAAENSPDALSNTLKHHIPAGSAALLSFDDFASLQQQADSAVGSGHQIPVADRSLLADLAVTNGTVSEGDAVRLVGFLAPDGTGPHANSSGESVNCGLTKSANNDFHIPVTADTSTSEFDSIVVEMIPQERPDEWTVKMLKSVQTKHKQVWIEGNLFYDGKHRVNADSSNPIGGQPKRFTLWEIHPVTKFLVCEQTDCDPADESAWQAPQ